MSRQLFTAADIRHLVNDQKSTTLILGANDLITPEAMDTAQYLGLALVRQEPVSGYPESAKLPPLKVVHHGGVIMDSFGADPAALATNVHLKDVITKADGAPMTAGYMSLEKGEFPWTLTYDEIDIVLEGELVITRGMEIVRGEVGDTIFIPKGSSITFGSPGFTRFVYVTFPADWNTT